MKKEEFKNSDNLDKEEFNNETTAIKFLTFIFCI